MAEVVEFSVGRVVFANARGWGVVTAEQEGSAPFSAVGTIANVRPGERVRARGTWRNHAKFGRQFEVDSFETTHPATERGITRWLESLDGVGPATAASLVGAYGERTLDVIREDPSKVAAVVGDRRADAVLRGMRDRGDEAEAAALLRQWDVPQHLLPALLRRWGGAAAEKVRENPYQLIADYSGVGFKTADAIALASGLALSSPHRIQAAVLHCLREAATRYGHTFQPRRRLLRDACRLLRLDSDTVLSAIPELEEKERLVVDGEAVYLRAYFDAEYACDADLRRLVAAPASGNQPTPSLEVEGSALTPKQREAVELSCSSKVLVVTGGPGSGKTWTTRAILASFHAAGLRVALCAPTGRAAKRLEESTGARAQTIHRLLAYHPEVGWRHNRRNQLYVDAVIVDEVSMVDVLLASRLLEALRDGCRLVLVGDADQLPSVGPGRVLRDVIESDAVPVVEFSDIMRQAAGSRIIANAHRVNKGAPIELAPEGAESDMYLVKKSDAEELADLVAKLAAETIPRRFGFDPMRDVWVLTPMHRAALGTDSLNKRLQALLNPDGRPFGKKGMRVGDRVMQHRNNYDLDVFNGDAGVVADHFAVTDEEAAAALAEYEARQAAGLPAPEPRRAGEYVRVAMDDGREKVYDQKAGRDLQLCYACTVHKAQGSEYPCVVLVCHTQHHIMLQRTLLYTGMTRARRLLVVAGTQHAVDVATAKADSLERNSGLGWRLAEGDARARMRRPGEGDVEGPEVESDPVDVAEWFGAVPE